MITNYRSLFIFVKCRKERAKRMCERAVEQKKKEEGKKMKIF